MVFNLAKKNFVYADLKEIKTVDIKVTDNPL